MPPKTRTTNRAKRTQQKGGEEAPTAHIAQPHPRTQPLPANDARAIREHTEAVLVLRQHLLEYFGTFGQPSRHAKWDELKESMRRALETHP